MNFDFDDDQKTLQRAVREFLERESPLSECRRVLESDDLAYSDKVWRGAGEMGWLGTRIPEAYGGAGMGHLELALVAEEVGRALSPIPFGSSAYLVTEALLEHGSDAQKERYLPRLASGELIGAFAHAEGAGRASGATSQTTLADGKLAGEKLPVFDGDVAGLYVVVASRDGGPCLCLAEPGDGVKVSPVTPLDPSRSMARVRFEGAAAEPLGDAGAAEIDALLDRAAVLMAFEQVGGANRSFDITRGYVMDRYVFGRPVGSFQAIKHRLADLFVDLELATSNAYFAAWALSAGSEELSTAAPAARVSASEAFDLSAVEMIQMHGGVGYTWEADCHLFYKRAKSLTLALGGPSEWRDKLILRLAKQAA